MKIIQEASGKKFSITKKEWEKIGREGGWIHSVAFHRGLGHGPSSKEVILYRDIDGEISPFDNGGEPIKATIEYTYSPGEKPEYEGSYITYPGAPASVEINEVYDEEGEEIPMRWIEEESLMEAFDLVKDYEDGLADH